MQQDGRGKLHVKHLNERARDAHLFVFNISRCNLIILFSYLLNIIYVNKQSHEARINEWIILVVCNS